MDSLFIVHLGQNPDVILYEKGRSEIEDITSSFMEVGVMILTFNFSTIIKMRMLLLRMKRCMGY
jgi:hypothetical protein